MEQVDLPELKEEELRAYFQAHLDDPVGIPRSAGGCPITKFYKDKYGIEITATHKKISLYSDDQTATQRRYHSSWSSRFTWLIDHWYSAHVMVSITGAQALKALDQAVEEANDMGSKGSLNGPSQGFHLLKG